MNSSQSKVLLVDDVEANLITLEGLLSSLDCELLRANGGNAALMLLLKHEFAVVLLDVQMPGMDGFEVAQYMRQNPKTHDTPIVFLTAMNDTPESALRGYGSGAVDFLTKPLNAAVLRAKVHVFLELHKGRQELLASLAAHQKTLAELEVANAALRHFTDAASHDLKAPLRSVRGFLSGLSQELGDQIGAQARDYLERSVRGAERMDHLLDSLLAYARLQRNLARSAIRCDVMFEQIKSDLREDLARANTTLETQALPAIQGDPERVYQLFCNLVGNALKFRRPEVPLCVQVSAQRSGDEGLFCVADNGVGIDLEHQARIFQPFFRSETQGKFKGSGLGLAICQQVVEQHGGRIWVESKPDQGSNFYFTLPLA